MVSQIERIEPPNWWVGMQNDTLQILVYGKDIAEYKPSMLSCQGCASLLDYHKADNPNYLFLDLSIPEYALPQSFPIFFRNVETSKSFSFQYELNENYTTKNILYAFVIDNEIKYIGKSVKTISQRLNGYRKPNISQRTNFRLNNLIIEKLREEKEVEIYLFEDNAELSYKGKKIKDLHTAKNPYEQVVIAQTELGELVLDDKTVLNSRLIKPHNFDPKKRYPVLVYVYNGPGVQLIQNKWLAGVSLWMHYLANQGYLVYTLDGRGSAHRGKVFEQATFRNLGFVEMEDWCGRNKPALGL